MTTDCWLAIMKQLFPEIRLVTMILAGLICLWLAVKMLGSYRTEAERYERSVRDLRSMIADARHLLSDARNDVKKLRAATTLAAEQINKLPSTSHSPLNTASEVAAESVEEMLKKIEKIGQNMEADEAVPSPAPSWLNPTHHSDSVQARYIAAALPFLLAATLILRAIWLVP